MKSINHSKEIQQEIRRRFVYDSGEIRYLLDTNCCKAGDIAGTEDSRGYKRVSVKKKKILVHRIIWFLHHDNWPECVDHINRDKSDNRIENLRACDKSQNKRNVSYGLGAGYRKLKNGRYEAYATINNCYTYLGTFNSASEAKTFRDEYLKGLYGDYHHVD